MNFALDTQTDVCLPDILEKFSEHSVLVVGDLMPDEYVCGTAQRASPEGPALIVTTQKVAASPGGAANVAANLRAMGAQVALVGVVGTDASGVQLASLLAAQGIDISGIIMDEERPTTCKMRIQAQNQHLLRLDAERGDLLDPALRTHIYAQVTSRLADADVVLASDYANGTLFLELAIDLGAYVRRGGPTLAVNTKPLHAGW